MAVLDTDAILVFLLEQSLALLVLSGVLYVIYKWAKGMEVRLRYGIGLIVLFKSVLFPIFYLPMIPSTWMDFNVSGYVGSAVAAEERAILTPVSSGPNQAQPLALDSGKTTGNTASESLAFTGRSSWSWSGILFCVWGTGCLIYLLLVLSNAWKVWRHLRAHRSEPDLDLECEFVDVFRSLGLMRRPRLCMIDGIEQPFVWGLHRGMIYLPHRFADIGSREHRRFVLAHELGHVVRRDAFFNLMQMIIQAIYWFHPAVWWLNARIRQEREKCCDDFALAATEAKAGEYATAVVDHLVYNGQKSYGLSALAMSGNARNLEDRINSIMFPGKRHRGSLSTVGLLQFGVMAILLLPFHPTQSQVARDSAETRSYKQLDLVGLSVANSPDLDVRFTELPKGDVEMEQIPYFSHSVFYPEKSENAASLQGASEKLNGVVGVKGRFSNLYMLHGVQGAAKSGMVVARCVLHYADSTHVSVPIQYGMHVRDWMFWEYEPVGDQQSKMAWVGSNAESRLVQAGLRLYHTPLSNPYPDREVLSLDYVSDQSECRPFLLGMTVDFRQ